MLPLHRHTTILQSLLTKRLYLNKCLLISTLDDTGTSTKPLSIELQRIAKYQHYWKLFPSSSSKYSSADVNNLVLPPAWLVSFCNEAQSSITKVSTSFDYPNIERLIQKSFPNYTSEHLFSTGRVSTNTNHWDQQCEDPPDHYLDNKIHIFPEDKYAFQHYDQSTVSVFPENLREKLCPGGMSKKYLQIGEAYAFPKRSQLPTSWGTEPAKLLVDPDNSIPTIYLQLSSYFPPSTWIPIRPSLMAVRRVLTEFALLAYAHRESHHGKYVKRWEEAKVCLVNQKIISHDDLKEPNEKGSRFDIKSQTLNSYILRYMGYMARAVPFTDVTLREFPNSQEFFCGEYENPERFIEYLESCPFFFAIPEIRSDCKDMWGQADRPGVAMSAFRCIFSKSLIWVKVHFSTEVKLPPADSTLFKKLWKEQSAYPASLTPVFIRAVWPDNVKMCGGGGILRFLNSVLGTEFARDMPIDAALAIAYVSAWAGRETDLMGVKKMRQRFQTWEHQVRFGSQKRCLNFGSYPGTSELPSPLYSDKERLGMHLQYLAHIGDPDIESTIRRWMCFDSGAIRLGCAKAALESGNMSLFLEIVQREVPGRYRKSMMRCVRSRKKRDLYDKLPRLSDDDFRQLKSRLRPVSLSNLTPARTEQEIKLDS